MTSFTGGRVKFDPAGYPLTIEVNEFLREGATVRHYTLTWEGDSLVRVSTQRLESNAEGYTTTVPLTLTFEYAGGRVVRRSSSLMGSDVLDYDGSGALIRWANANDGFERRFVYDARGWLREVRNGPTRDLVEYDANGCPARATTHPIDSTMEYITRYDYSSDGRLTSYLSSHTFGGESPHAVMYGDAGLLSVIGGIFIRYEPGEARGLDLDPVHFAGNDPGLPARTELLRLDGRCEPRAMRSQATILTMLVTERL